MKTMRLAISTHSPMGRDAWTAKQLLSESAKRSARRWMVPILKPLAV
jgi:hypothetical protein